MIKHFFQKIMKLTQRPNKDVVDHLLRDASGNEGLNAEWTRRQVTVIAVITAADADPWQAIQPWLEQTVLHSLLVVDTTGATAIAAQLQRLADEHPSLVILSASPGTPYMLACQTAYRMAAGRYLALAVNGHRLNRNALEAVVALHIRSASPLIYAGISGDAGYREWVGFQDILPIRHHGNSLQTACLFFPKELLRQGFRFSSVAETTVALADVWQKAKDDGISPTILELEEIASAIALPLATRIRRARDISRLSSLPISYPKWLAWLAALVPPSAALAERPAAVTTPKIVEQAA